VLIFGIRPVDISKLNKKLAKRMSTSGILRHVTLLRTDVSEERSATITGVTKIVELRTALAEKKYRSTEHAKRRNIPVDGIL
jgi:hypothetical protein